MNLKLSPQQIFWLGFANILQHDPYLCTFFFRMAGLTNLEDNGNPNWRSSRNTSRFTEEQMIEILSQAKTSSVPEAAKRNGIGESTIRLWRKQLTEKTKNPPSAGIGPA